MNPNMITLLAFGAIAIALMWRMVQPTPRLVIGSRGILDRRLGLGWIRWDEIEGAYRMKGHRSDGIFLRVRVSDRLAHRLPHRPGEPAPGRVELPVELDGTTVSGVELLQKILRHGACNV